MAIRSLLVLLAIGLALAAARAEASKIVYSCAPDLCGVDPESAVSSPITNDGGSSAYRYPSLSRDGSRVAAARAAAVVVGPYGADLAEPWGGTRDMNDVAISPDGNATGESHSYVETRYGCPFTGGCLELVDRSRTFFQVGPDPAASSGSFPGGGGVGFLGSRSLLSSFYTVSTDTNTICVVADPAASEAACQPRIVSTKALLAPAGSADGALIAVATAGEPGAASVDLYDAGSGALLRRLAAAGTDPTFSPDGERVAYSAPDGWIYVVPTKGGPARRLVKGDSPSWGGGDGPGPALASPKVRYRNGRLGVKLRCGGQVSCRGTVRFKRGRTMLGARSFRLKAGRAATVKVKVSKRGRGKLERSFPSRLVLQLKPAEGKLVTQRLPLRR